MGIGNYLGNPMCSRFLCVLVTCFLPSFGFAFSSTSSGNATTYVGFTASPSNIAPYVVSTASDGTVLVRSPRSLIVAGGGSIPIDVTGSIPRPTASAAIGRFLGKSLPVLGVGVALYDLAQELGFTLNNSSGPLVVTKADPAVCTVAPCYEYRVNDGSRDTGFLAGRQQACTRFAQIFQTTNPSSLVPYVGTPSATGLPGGACFVTRSDGSAVGSGTIQTRSISPASSNVVASTEQQFLDAIAAKTTGWPTSSALALATKNAIAAGDSLPVASPVVSGPATAPASTTTTVDPSTGNTTTTVVAISNSYVGPTVTTTTTTTTTVTNTSSGAPVGQPTVTTTSAPVAPSTPPAESVPVPFPCGIPGTPPCAVKVDELGTPVEVPADKFKPMLDEGKQAQEDLLDQVKADTDKSFFEPFTDLFVTPALAECVPLEIPGDRGTIDPCGTVGGARAIMAYIWALSGLGLCLHMVRSAL